MTEEKGGQVAHPSGGKQPHDKGISAATRELGIERTEARRSVKIDNLTPEAKQAAVETGRADSQSALLQAAKAAPEKQAEVIRSYEPVRKWS